MAVACFFRTLAVVRAVVRYFLESPSMVIFLGLCVFVSVFLKNNTEAKSYFHITSRVHTITMTYTVDIYLDHLVKNLLKHFTTCQRRWVKKWQTKNINNKLTNKHEKSLICDSEFIKLCSPLLLLLLIYPSAPVLPALIPIFVFIYSLMRYHFRD